jgi:hypothetical protein
MTMPSPQRPPQTAWGAAIGRHRVLAGLSIRRAGPLAGMSDRRWGQIESGYEVPAKGSYAPVRGSAEAVARMALVVGMTASELADTGREDAAAILARMQTPSDLAARILQMSRTEAADLLAAIAEQLGFGGQQSFASGRRFGT